MLEIKKYTKHDAFGVFFANLTLSEKQTWSEEVILLPY